MTDDVKDWCRTFDTPEGKVLVYLEYDTDEEEDVVHFVIKLHGTMIDAKFSGFDGDISQQKFDQMATQQYAETFAKDQCGLFGGKLHGG